MMINLNNIEYNPHRDFTAYPINEEQVEALMHSIEETGFWDNILVRKHPIRKARYQLAYGHHRLEAALAKGIEDVDIACKPLTDNDMLKIMINENSTQAGGQSVSATLDSVKASLRYIGYVILDNDYKGVCGILQTLLSSEDAYNSAKGLLLKGNGLGRDLIHAYDSLLSLTDIQIALKTLKADGSFKEVLEDIKARITKEQDDLRAKAQRTKGVTKDKAEKDAKAKDVILDDVDKAVGNAPETTLGKGLSQYFNNSHQQDTFAKAMQSETAVRFIPIDQHEPIAKQMVTEANAAGVKQLTAKYIQDYVNAITSKALGIQTRNETKEKLKEEKNAAHSLLKSGAKTLRDSNERQKNATITIKSVLERFPELVTNNLINDVLNIVDNQISVLTEFKSELNSINPKDL